jgi:hypothetical protein
MCIWALREFGEFIWADWYTLMVKEPQDDFYEYCREHQTPKFIRIKHYWAIVNCGVYYAPYAWLDRMVAGLEANLSEPNDELWWAAVLPKDVVNDSRFWWGIVLSTSGKRTTCKPCRKQRAFCMCATSAGLVCRVHRRRKPAELITIDSPDR